MCLRDEQTIGRIVTRAAIAFGGCGTRNEGDRGRTLKGCQLYHTEVVDVFIGWPRTGGDGGDQALEGGLSSTYKRWIAVQKLIQLQSEWSYTSIDPLYVNRGQFKDIPGDMEREKKPETGGLVLWYIRWMDCVEWLSIRN